MKLKDLKPELQQAAELADEDVDRAPEELEAQENQWLYPGADVGEAIAQIRTRRRHRPDLRDPELVDRPVPEGRRTGKPE